MGSASEDISTDAQCWKEGLEHLVLVSQPELDVKCVKKITQTDFGAKKCTY